MRIKIGLSVDEKTYKQFKIVCKVLGREISETVEELMKNFITQHSDLLKKPLEEAIK